MRFHLPLHHVIYQLPIRFPIMRLNTAFDFTTDSKGYWDGMWENDPALGVSKVDPDAKSDTLRYYQYLLYRRELPNGEFFDLQYHNKPNLVWNGKRFSSDSIIVSFRYRRYPVMEEISARPDFRQWVEGYLREAYTIGGEMLFPVDPSINSVRGFNNNSVSDRFDLTLYCIQEYYKGTESLDDYGLDRVLDAVRKNGNFFDKFLNFKGYVDFFFLQDAVDENYDTILYLDYLGKPRSVKDYDIFLAMEMDFLRKRNKRISEIELKPVVYSPL